VSQGLVLAVMNQTIYEILVLSVPLLGAAMVVGLIISIFQATTSIQEQTLTFVPKLIVILLMLMIAGQFFLNHLSDFTRNLFDLISRTRI